MRQSYSGIVVMVLVFFLFYQGSGQRVFANNLKSAASQKIVVVTNINNRLESLNHEDVVDIFMGKTQRLAMGINIKPVEIENNLMLKKDFYEKLTGQSLARVNAYWSRARFSGRVRPPTKLDSVPEAVGFLADNEEAIAYVYASDVTADLKVVYRFDE